MRYGIFLCLIGLSACVHKGHGAHGPCPEDQGKIHAAHSTPEYHLEQAKIHTGIAECLKTSKPEAKGECLKKAEAPCCAGMGMKDKT